ncbi:MAG: hypothetical protein JRJ23_11910 [Deltaproteobacteria bacterium]|nr:hypothetical protein [Deltaproteobacteria bacterium]
MKNIFKILALSLCMIVAASYAYAGQGNGGGWGTGTGSPGANFVDADGDGINDNAGKRMGQGWGRKGKGKSFGNHHRQGPRDGRGKKSRIIDNQSRLSFLSYALAWKGSLWQQIVPTNLKTILTSIKTPDQKFRF